MLSKNEQLAKKQRKLRGQLWNFQDNFSAKGIILQYTSKLLKGFIYYYYNITLRKNNFSRRTHVHCSCIFCGFLGMELSTSFLFVRHWPWLYAKSLFLVFLDHLKVVSWISFHRNKIRQQISNWTADIIW